MLRQFTTLKNYSLAAKDGEIGKVKALYFDDRHWIARYLVVDAGGWLGGREVLIAPQSLGLIEDREELIAVHLTRQEVKDSPLIETEKPISRRYEEDWHRYYGYAGYWQAPEPLGLPPLAPLDIAPRRETLEVEPGDPHLRSTGEVAGYTIHATDGEIGKIDDFLVDDADWVIRYLAITRSWWEWKDVPLSTGWVSGVDWSRQEVRVNIPREVIRTAPQWDASTTMTREFEQHLFAHYGRPNYWPVLV